MELRAENGGDFLVVHVGATRIDAASAIEFKDRVKALAQSGPAQIVLNLERVNFVDSSGLGAIVAAMKQIGPGRKLDLAGLTPSVQKVFRLTRMDNVFRIYGSIEDLGGVTSKAS